MTTFSLIREIFAADKHFLQSDSFYGYVNNIFDDVVRYESTKNWAILKYNAIVLYCPFYIIEKLTFSSSIWISYLSDPQIQMLKNRKCEKFPHFRDLREPMFELDESSLLFNNKTKNIQSNDRKFVVKQYNKSL